MAKYLVSFPTKNGGIQQLSNVSPKAFDDLLLAAIVHDWKIEQSQKRLRVTFPDAQFLELQRA